MRYIKKITFVYIYLLSLVVCSVSASAVQVMEEPGKVEYLDVTGVNEHDVLSMRQSDNSQSMIVYRIPYNASGILKLNASKGWVKVSYNGYTGWASSKFLKKGPAPTVKSDFAGELFCLGTEPHWILNSDGNSLDLKKYDVFNKYIFDASVKKSINETGIWWLSAVKVGKDSETTHHVSVVITKNELCSDGMSDSKYTYSVILGDNEVNLLSGCCKNK